MDKTHHDWRLLRFLLRHLLIGAGAGWIFVAALLILNIAGLRDLMTASSTGWLACAMLLAVMTITWGSAAMGTAVFLMRGKDDDTRRPGKRTAKRAGPLSHPAALAPIAVRKR